MPRPRTYLYAFAAGAVIALIGLGGVTWLSRPASPPAPATASGTTASGTTASGAVSTASALPAVTVFKTPTCGCCTKWVDHLREHGFEVTVTDLPDLTPVKQRFHVPDPLHACHTAAVGTYVVEGHVPAADIERLLAEQPDITGIAVPGMPIGSPGMEQGDRQDPYDVIAFDRNGPRHVFTRYRP